MKKSDKKDFQRLLEDLERQGWEPMVCDSPVPFYDNAVMCGVPNGVGDVVKETMMLPKEFLSMQPEFVVKAKGDSMKGIGIEEGDVLQVVTDVQAMDGDTVMVLLDGDYTIKTYCEDETGHPWLVPQNEAYEPIRLEDYERVTIVGVVKRVTKCAPRANYRTCMRIINRAKEKQPEMRAVSPEQVARAVRRVAPMVQVGRQWYAVYRVLADCKVVKEGDFGTFCELVKGEVPEHECLPTRVELQRMAVQSFAKPVAMWNEANAPVQGKRFKDYARIAERMQEIVEN